MLSEWRQHVYVYVSLGLRARPCMFDPSVFAAATRVVTPGSMLSSPDLGLGTGTGDYLVGDDEFRPFVRPSSCRAFGIRAHSSIRARPGSAKIVSSRVPRDGPCRVASRGGAGPVRTHEALLRSVAPRVVTKLGAHVLPMVREPQFYGFFANAPLMAPRCPFPTTSQPGA